MVWLGGKKERKEGEWVELWEVACLCVRSVLERRVRQQIYIPPNLHKDSKKDRGKTKRERVLKNKKVNEQVVP